MDKEVIRSLCHFMAAKHNIELDGIRIGSNQKTRLGSAVMHKNIFTGDITRLSVSISTYNTTSGNEYWDTHNKVSVLDTIVHEFAHLEHYRDGRNPGHGVSWRQTYHQFLLQDWKEIVAMYNILAVDYLDDSWELMVKHNQDTYFDAERFFTLLGKESINYTTVITGIVREKGRSWISILTDLEKIGMTIRLGDKKFVIERNSEPVAELIKEGGKLEIVK